MNKKTVRKLGVSTIGGIPTPEMLTAYAKNHIDSMEISCSAPDYETLDWKAVSRAAEENGVRLNSVHLPFSGAVNIANPDDTLCSVTMECYRTVMENAASIGIPIAVVHPSSEPIPDDIRPALMEKSKKHLRILAEWAQEFGMTVAVENLPRTCLGRDSGEMLEILAADNRLRVCFDTNHLLKEPTTDFLRTVGSRIITLHVSDYDFINERHLLPGEGKIEWKAFMDELDAIGYEGIFTYEVSFAAESSIIRRPRALTPADFRANYESLVRRDTPIVVGGELKF